MFNNNIPHNYLHNLEQNINQPNLSQYYNSNIDSNSNINQNMNNLNMNNMNYQINPMNFNKQSREKQQINNILQEMIQSYKNRDRKNFDIDSKSSNYFLLYSIDPLFRNEVCNLIKNIYNKYDVKENQINLETIKFLLNNNNSEMEFLYNKFSNPEF